MHPLEGMRVVALEHAVAAPLCSRHLADLGADVIKIERPGEGDFARDYDSFVHGQASFFIWLNRGKRSVTLDVKHPDAARGAATAGRRRRRAGAEPRTRRGGAARPEPCGVGAAPSETGGLRHLRLRRERAVRAEEGLRSADPGGSPV